ncbi:MAG: site-2 protease family protein [Aquificae bacterium]|nr:site-2 protease family protein [Aquificota bacterium]
MFAKTIPLFRLFGIQINLDYSWFIVFFLITSVLALGYFPYAYPHYPFIVYWIVGAFSAVLLFLSVLLHELAHSLVALRFGLTVKEIDLFIFGGVALIEEEAPNPKVEFLIAIAGPIASFFIGSFFFLLAVLYPVDDIINGVINYLMFVNFIIALFNLVPAFPLDGGRILRAIIWAKKDLLTATKISAKTGTIFAYFLMFMGLLSLFKGNFLNGMWYGLIGLFLKQASQRSYEQTKISYILSKYKVQHFLVTVKPLLPEQTLYEVFSYYYPFYHLRIYPVIGKDGKIYVIDILKFKNLPQEQLMKIKVGDVAEPIKVYVSPFDNLTKALRLMNKYGSDELPVIYENTILGVIRRITIESVIEKELSKGA